MLIPLRTDYYARRRPVVTEAIIIVTALVYLLDQVGPFFGWFEPRALHALGAFWPARSEWWTLITYQFLHAPFVGDAWALLHIIFNMLFLWVFGAPVEDRMGRVGFLAFYLIGGMAAGIGHAFASSSPVIGASGSVAAVTGAYLVLFPRSTVMVWFFGILHLGSVWLIGLYIVLDILRSATGFLGGFRGGVAYEAHLAGYAFGFVVTLALLGLRLIRRQDVDLLFLLSQMRRRRAFRAAQRPVRGGMWDQPTAPKAGESLKPARERPMTEAELRIADRRAEIARLIADHDLGAAAARYRELLAEDPAAAFDEPRQVDLANQLYAGGDHATAARAYELFLERYSHSARGPEVRLILAMLYARRLGRHDRARELLELARPKLGDPKQAELAGRLLAELGA
jgi:membrane associated rhomboid family serine protease